MNAFPHQQRADHNLRPGARALRSRHSVLVQVPADALRTLPQKAGHHVAWRRSWSAERYAVLLLDLQRLASARLDEVTLQLREDHSHVPHRLAHRCAGVSPDLVGDQPPVLLLGQTD
jgi:hypothetical protein